MINHESEAKRLDECLSKNAECHDPALRPFVETAEAVTREASTRPTHLDANVAKRQRNMLMSQAEQQKKPQLSARQMWTGSLATATVALLIAVVVVMMPGSPFGVPPQTSISSVSRLVIPEARAADAFGVVAIDADRVGIDTTTTFVVTSTVDVSLQQLRESLRVVPSLTVDGSTPTPVPVTIAADGDRRFIVTPESALAAGTVYRVTVATDVARADGTKQAREFSWAMQTKQVFRVLSSVPAPESSAVPVTTGIEFELSQTGWVEESLSVVSEPKINGRIETRGRTLTFVPTAPLKPGTIHTVTLKRGLAVAGSDLTLQEDAVLRFETAPVIAENKAPRIMVSEPLLTTSPSKDIQIPAYWEGSLQASIRATGYAVSLQDARAMLLEYGTTPEFAYEYKRRGDLFARRASAQAFVTDATMETAGYQTFVHLPKVAAGRYVVRLVPENGEATWVYVESTDIATYVIADAKMTVVWAMNADGSRPLEGMPVAYDAVTSKTDVRGVAELATPPAAVSTSTNAVVVTVGDGAMTSLILMRSQGGGVHPWYRYGFARPMGTDTTVSMMYVDRPLYHPTDATEIFGMAQDRASGGAADNVSIELTRNGIYEDWWPTEQKVYRSQKITPDAQGFYRATLAWENFAPGYYQIAVRRNGETVASRSIEVREFVKPAYTLEILTKRAVFSGEQIEGEVVAKFFSGAPVPGLALTAQTFGSAHSRAELTTDENGRASFSFPALSPPCDLSRSDVYCQGIETTTVEARPTDGEDALIVGSAWVNVWRASVSLVGDVRVTDATADVTFTARQVDLSQVARTGGEDVLGEPVRNARITGRVIERKWVQTETDRVYDPIEKVTTPRYTYTLEERDVAQINVITDTMGKARFPFSMVDGVSYRIIASMSDAQNRVSPVTLSAAKGWWNDSSYAYQNGVSFEPTSPAQQRYGYHVGERISVGFFENGSVLPKTPAPTYLYVQAHLGIQRVDVADSAVHEFTFGEEHVPNMNLHAVAFVNGQFVERSFQASLDQEDRKLKVTVMPDQTSYAPGATATVRVSVKDADGKGVRDARVALGTVDEALFAAASSDGTEYPLNALYAWVSDGIIASQASHLDISARNMFGGAEMGGGGGDVVRRNFKDTASFDVVTTDGSGEATQRIKLPDNLTNWRVTAVAATENRFAGTGRAAVIVSKPVFVDIVAPTPLLSTDAPMLKLRAYGDGLKAGDVVTFVVDAPSLGIRAQTVTSTAFIATYLPVTSLPLGKHPLTIRVQSRAGADALEKKIEIVTSRLTTDARTETDLVSGATLPTEGISREVDVEFLPKTRAQYLWRVRGLASPWSARLEAQIAGRIARTILRESFAVADVAEDTSVAAYQKTSGGLSILPYASEDVALSSKVAALLPDAFDRTTLGNYLWNTLAASAITREEQIQALSGLAALGQPVLSELQDVARTPELGWREQLAVMRGLEAAGDREAARTMLNTILASAETHDGLMMVRVAEDKRSQTEATAEVAAMAAALADPRATQLDAWLVANWADDAMTDLDRVAYLKRIVPAVHGSDVTIRYTVGGAEQSMTLTDGMTNTETFTAEELAQFRVIESTGSAVAVMTQRVATRPAQSKDLAISRTYKTRNGGAVQTLTERDYVDVTLTIKWSQSAQDGCYTVRDYLPAGMAAMVYAGFVYAPADTSWYPSEVNGNEVSFVACKSSEMLTRAYSYRARVMARGSYTAEPAILQSMTAPSQAAHTAEQRVTIQ